MKSCSEIVCSWKEYAKGSFCFLFKIVHRGLIIFREVYIIALIYMISKIVFSLSVSMKKRQVNILIFFFLTYSKKVQLQPLYL